MSGQELGRKVRIIVSPWGFVSSGASQLSRTLGMSAKECKTPTILQQHLGRMLTAQEAAAELAITERQFYCIKRRFLDEGDAGLVHPSCPCPTLELFLRPTGQERCSGSLPSKIPGLWADVIRRAVGSQRWGCHRSRDAPTMAPYDQIDAYGPANSQTAQTTSNGQPLSSDFCPEQEYQQGSYFLGFVYQNSAPTLVDLRRYISRIILSLGLVLSSCSNANAKDHF